MGQKKRRNFNGVELFLAVTAAGAVFFALPSVAQRPSGSTGHASAGHVAATRPISPGRSFGTPMRSGQRVGTIRANSFGASSAPPPSWELPKNVTPHWEIPSYIPVQPNPVRGNRLNHGRVGYGVGYVGLPYYADPLAFVDADTDNDMEDAGEQAQPNGPARPDYAPQEPYAEGAANTYEEDGYPPPPRAPYSPDAYPRQQQNSALEQSDGLDHPAVTLVFNDGRPPLQVHSYALTGSSVFVADSGHQRVIPITDLNLPATIAQNRVAGVDFELPGGSR